MATSVIESYGRWTFELVKDDETTTRTINVPYPKDPVSAESAIENAVSLAKNLFASEVYNTMIQPSNWRDDNDTEEQWTVAGLKYEVIQTITTPFE